MTTSRKKSAVSGLGICPAQHRRRWESLDIWTGELEPERTLQEVGDIMGITRERVRQIEVEAIRKLQRACAFNEIKWEEFCHVYGGIRPSTVSLDEERASAIAYSVRHRRRDARGRFQPEAYND